MREEDNLKIIRFFFKTTAIALKELCQFVCVWARINDHPSPHLESFVVYLLILLRPSQKLFFWVVRERVAVGQQQNPLVEKKSRQSFPSTDFKVVASYSVNKPETGDQYPFRSKSAHTFLNAGKQVPSFLVFFRKEKINPVQSILPRIHCTG